MAALHRDSAERGGASLRVVDWYLGLSLGQKIVVGVAVGTLVFVGSYLASLLIFSVAGVERADSPPQGQTPAPGSPRPGASPSSASASASASSAPAIALKIKQARWEGDKAVVEGRWRRDFSSVHWLDHVFGLGLTVLRRLFSGDDPCNPGAVHLFHAQQVAVQAHLVADYGGAS
jgi:hypothetical protein